MANREQVRDALAWLVNCVVTECDARQAFLRNVSKETHERRAEAGRQTTEALERVADLLADAEAS